MSSYEQFLNLRPLGSAVGETDAVALIGFVDSEGNRAAVELTADGMIPVKESPSADQDPIFDHDNGELRTGVTTSTLLITPPAGCKYCRVSSDVDCFINTADGTAADDAGSIKIFANSPETIPVVPGTDVNVAAATSASVRATPMMAR